MSIIIERFEKIKSNISKISNNKINIVAVSKTFSLECKNVFFSHFTLEKRGGGGGSSNSCTVGAASQ